RWQLVPDGNDPATPGFIPNEVLVQFSADPRAGRPSARLQPSGRDTPLGGATIGLNTFGAVIDLSGLAPGTYTVEIIERLAGGAEAVAGSTGFILSQPEYVVWTLDFEGDASGDAELANTAAIADGLRIPMTIMWNPRVWTTAQVSPARAEAMLAWTKARGSAGDEIALHLHMWTDYVRAAALVPRT